MVIPRFSFDPSLNEEEDIYSLGVDIPEQDFELPELSATNLGSFEMEESPPLMFRGEARAPRNEPIRSIPQPAPMMQQQDPLAMMADRMRKLFDTTSIDAKIQEKRNLLDSQILDSYKNPETNMQDTLLNAAISAAPMLLASAFIDTGRYGDLLLKGAGASFKRTQDMQTAEAAAEQEMRKTQARQTAQEIGDLINEKKAISKSAIDIEKELFLKSIPDTTKPSYTDETLLAISQQAGIPFEALRGAPASEVDNLIKQLKPAETTTTAGYTDEALRGISQQTKIPFEVLKGAPASEVDNLIKQLKPESVEKPVDLETAKVLTAGTEIDPQTLVGKPFSQAMQTTNVAKTSREKGFGVPLTLEERQNYATQLEVPVEEIPNDVGRAREFSKTIQSAKRIKQRREQLDIAQKKAAGEDKTRPSQKTITAVKDGIKAIEKTQQLANLLKGLGNNPITYQVLKELPGFDENLTKRALTQLVTSARNAAESGVLTDSDRRAWTGIVVGGPLESPATIARGLEELVIRPSIQTVETDLKVAKASENVTEVKDIFYDFLKDNPTAKLPGIMGYTPSTEFKDYINAKTGQVATPSGQPTAPTKVRTRVINGVRYPDTPEGRAQFLRDQRGLK